MRKSGVKLYRTNYKQTKELEFKTYNNACKPIIKELMNFMRNVGSFQDPLVKPGHQVTREYHICSPRNLLILNNMLQPDNHRVLLLLNGVDIVVKRICLSNW